MSTTPNDPMVDVDLRRVLIRDGADFQYIYLVERGGHRGFPIVIGTAEALEIDRVVREEATPRPTTHQLAFDAIRALGGDVVRVDIIDLKNNTFYARLELAGREGEPLGPLDARPSDAIAIALRAGCPLRVSESVLEEVRTDKSGPDEAE